MKACTWLSYVCTQVTFLWRCFSNFFPKKYEFQAYFCFSMPIYGKKSCRKLHKTLSVHHYISKSFPKGQKYWNLREWPNRFCHPSWPLCTGKINNQRVAEIRNGPFHNFFLIKMVGGLSCQWPVLPVHNFDIVLCLLNIWLGKKFLVRCIFFLPTLCFFGGTRLFSYSYLLIFSLGRCCSRCPWKIYHGQASAIGFLSKMLRCLENIQGWRQKTWSARKKLFLGWPWHFHSCLPGYEVKTCHDFEFWEKLLAGGHRKVIFHENVVVSPKNFTVGSPVTSDQALL